MKVLPEFPRMPHLPWKPNTEHGDLIVSNLEAAEIFKQEVCIEEKVDGANCGMSFYKDHPVIRGRSRLLRKGDNRKTPAGKQFSTIWNWWQENKTKFETLSELAGPVSVYGEWMVAQHGMKYDLLPDWFLAYGLYDWESKEFIDVLLGRKILQQAGFHLVPLLWVGMLESWEDLERLVNQDTSLSSEGHREGLVIKISDGNKLLHQFKMVRPGFAQGILWDNENMKKNSLRG